MKCRLTRESARAAGACYSDERIACLVPPLGLTPAQVARLPIPPGDRYWALAMACGASQSTKHKAAVWCANKCGSPDKLWMEYFPSAGFIQTTMFASCDEILADMVDRLKAQNESEGRKNG
jgi:hypothetical protein